MSLEIVYYANETLRKKAQVVDLNEETLTNLSKKMIATMYQADGIGLAGPQIGESKRIFVIDVKDFENPSIKEEAQHNLYTQMPLIIINPTIKFKENSEIISVEEGCLSIPGIKADVERPKEIYLSAELIDGKKLNNILCDGLLSRCIQHEYDHLEGILFIDKIHKKQYKKIEKKLLKVNKKWNS